MTEVGQRIIQEVRRIAAENPGYVYAETSCHYFYCGQSSCIMGKALANLGILSCSIARERERDIEGKDVWCVVKALGIHISDSEKFWLLAVQQVQDGSSAHHDGRAPWGRAVEIADEVYP